MAVFLALLLCASGSLAYSVLTHEEIADLVWAELRPLLLKRFPGLTEDQLKEAHGYDYGGAVIQDLGYYPFGSVEFSNLVYRMRTSTLLPWGAFAHYASDIAGHPAANASVSSNILSCGRSTANASATRRTKPRI